MTIALRQRPLARVVMGIVKAGNGAWFDPSDMTTLYQDAAGTIPVTAVEQPVGLILDKSQGLMLGPQNPICIGVGWTGSGTTYTKTAQSWSVLGIDNLVVGRFYKVTFKVSSVTTSGNISIFRRKLDNTGNDVLATFSSAVGVLREAIVSIVTTTYDCDLWLDGDLFTGTITDFSICELKGNHATQSVTASRPVLSARYNLLTKTEDFSDAVWTKNSVSVTTSQYLSPIGTFTANKVTLKSGAVTTGNDGVGAFASPLITANGSAYTLSLFAKSAGSNYIRFREAVDTGQRVKINLIDGSFVGEASWSPSTFTVTVTPAPNGFFLIQITRSAPTTFCFNIKGGDDVGDGINGFYVWGADLRISTSAGPYQRVNTATDYDTDPRYFPKYLRFDGVDDYLNLPYMGLYANGSASVVAATTVKPSTWSTILAEGAGGQGGLYILARYTGTNKLGTFIQDDNVNLLRSLETPITQGITTVLSVVDAGSAITHWVSSRLAGSSNYTRSGTLTSAVTLVGARPYVDTLNGNLYGLIITKSALSDAQRIACERHLSRKSGVQL